VPKQLLAKSPHLDRGNLSLEQHLTDTAVAVRAIFKGRILENWSRFFRLKDSQVFLLHLTIAALFHDLGKANADFYNMVQKQCKQQTLRHEWLSALILHLPAMRHWLQTSDLNCDVVTAAVLCHHLQSRSKEWGKPRAASYVTLYLQHPEVRRILNEVANLLQLPEVPDLPELWDANDAIWQTAYQQANRSGSHLGSQMRRDSDLCSLVMAVKAGLIAADAVASGVFRTRGSHAIEDWVDATLHQPAISSNELEEKILQPRYAQIERKLKRPFELNDPQKLASGLGDRILTLMACGSGKTLFGYKWMQGVLDRHELGRLIFLYPTRGTATEGFRDYVAWAPETEASLLTGTANYELQAMRDNPPESLRNGRTVKSFQVDERMYALGFWQKRFFSATVDQFLSFLTHRYASICLLPVLVDSALIVDEVHSFSERMFKSLTSFLTHFDHPILCMTATLPATRQKDLTQKRKKERPGSELLVFPTQDDRETLETLEEAENSPRYNIHPIPDLNARDRLIETAIDAYRPPKPQRVLWVVNTVDRCREIAWRLEQELSESVLVYHSRFRLKDRHDRHNETVSAFAMKSDEPKPAIAVTTQVCEMSLDLDADVLITEQAPITSLVQRFGRANRHLARGKKFQAQIYVYPTPKQLPYNDDELKGVEAFLNEVTGIASQAQLAEALQKRSPPVHSAKSESAFTKSSYWAVAESYREDDGYSISVVLDRDLKEVRQCMEDKKPIDGFILPIPRHLAKSDDRPEWLPNYLAIADANLYCEKMGFGKK